jgi:AAA domain
VTARSDGFPVFRFTDPGEAEPGCLRSRCGFLPGPQPADHRRDLGLGHLLPAELTEPQQPVPPQEVTRIAPAGQRAGIPELHVPEIVAHRPEFRGVAIHHEERQLHALSSNNSPGRGHRDASLRQRSPCVFDHASPSHQTEAVGPLTGHPVGAENCVTLCDLGVFADQAAEPVPPQKAHTGHFSRRMRTPGGRVLLQRPMRPMDIVVIGVLSQDQPAAVLDALPGLGKTTAALAFGRWFHREQIDQHGPQVQARDGTWQRIPVAYLGLTSHTTMRSLNAMLCRFYGLPERGNADVLAHRAAECVMNCKTRLVIVDDVHFLDISRRDGREVANHFKWLACCYLQLYRFLAC